MASAGYARAEEVVKPWSWTEALGGYGRHSHWPSVPSLWGGIVGAPGTKKSPGIYAAMQSMGKLIRAAHAEAMREYKKRLKKAPEEDRDDPHLNRLLKNPVL
jgi:hypothetical protein